MGRSSMSEARTASWSGLCPRPFPMKETRRATRVPLLRSPWWYPQTMRGRASRPRRALRPGIWDHRRDFRARGGSGLYRAASTMELSKPLASAVHLQTMSRAHFIKSQIVGRPVSHRSAFVEDVIALIVVILTLAVLTCLAAIAPAGRGIVYCGRTFAVFVHQGRPRDVSSVKTSSRGLRRRPAKKPQR